MKRNSLYLILSLFLFLALSNACKKEEFTEEDAIKLINKDAMVADSMAKAVYFTVKVIDASTDFSLKSAGGEKSVSGLAGATVTVKSANSTQTGTTGADGSATFANLRPGTYSVKIDQTGFTSVDFTAKAIDNGYFSVQIPVLSTAAASMMTITGTVTYETNLLNVEQEPAAAVKVMVEPDIASFFNATGVDDVAYSGYSTSFTTDAQGVYTATVPADKAGKLTYDISVPTVEVNQSLMMNTVNGVVANGAGNSAKTILTRFGTSNTTATTVPSVNPVYCVFAAPPTVVDAQLVAEIYDSKSFNSVHLNTSGKGYTNDAQFTKTAPTGGTDAVFTIKTESASGQNKIAYITVSTAGSGFTTTDLNLSMQQQAPDWRVSSVNGSGGITGITNTSVVGNDGRGRFLTSTATNFSPITVSTSAGINAVISINSFTSTSLGYQINGLTATTAGTGYVVGDKVNVSIDGTKTTAANATGYLGGSKVTNIIVTTPGSGYPKNITDLPIKFSTGDAVATASTDNAGKITSVVVSDGGKDYTAVPIVTANYANKLATANVYVNNGKVESVFGLDGGKGYNTVPALTFYNQYLPNNPVVAVNATVTVNGSAPYEVTAVNINSTSVKDLSKNKATTNGDGAVNDLKSVPGGKEYKNFYLGTGVRTIVD